jgi:hypothetical protein
MIQPSTVLINTVHESQIECESLTQRQKIGLPQMRAHPNQTAATHCNPNKTLGTVRLKLSFTVLLLLVAQKINWISAFFSLFVLPKHEKCK